MTGQDSQAMNTDMVRAEKLARELRVNRHIDVFVPVPGDGPSVAKINSDGVDAIASLIQEVRNETLDVVKVHLIEKGRAAKSSSETKDEPIDRMDYLGQATALLEAALHVISLKTQTQDTKEGESK